MVKETLKRNINNHENIQNVLYNLLQSSFMRNALTFCFGILIGGATISNHSTVAGVSFVGALGGGFPAFSGLLGVMIGYIYFHGTASSFLYIGASIFAYTIKYLFQLTALYRSKSFMPLIVFTLILLIRSYGAVNIVRGDTEYIMRYWFEALCGGFLTYLYALFLRRDDFSVPREFYYYSLFTLLASILSGIQCVLALTNISLPVIVCVMSVFAVLYKVDVQSFPIAAMLGTAMQFGITARDDALAVFLLYSLAEILPLKKNKLLLSVYMVLMTFLCELYHSNFDEMVWRICEIILGASLFACIPQDIMIADVGEYKNSAHNLYKQKIKDIRNLSRLMLSLSDESPCVLKPEAQAPDMSLIFDCALEQVCNGCEKKSICWEKQCVDSAALLHRSTKYISARGRMEMEDLSNHFRLTCIRSHSIVLAVNFELRRWYLSERLSESERMNMYLCKQNNRLLGQLLKVFSLQVLNPSAHDAILCEQQYSVEIGLACKRKSGERVCGDAVRYFKTTDGMLYVILSDGIGCGEEAEQYSAHAVSIIENGLRVFNDPFSVIELTHTTLQSLSPWATATIDLLCVNLHSGELSFLKLGADSSYVFTNDEMIQIDGNSYSAGTQFDMSEIQSTGMQITDDTTIIMTSDGVIFDIHDIAIKNVIYKTHSMKKTAKQLLLNTEYDSDDKTVVAISISNKNHAV